MMERSGSILAADFGSVTTRLVLVDVVEGAYRLVARAGGPSTVGFPIDDASIGLRRLVDEIGKRAGRTFYDAGGEMVIPEGMDRTGVEAFVTTATAGRPMRVAIVGLVEDVSVASARRVLSSSFVEVVATLTLEDGRDEEGRMNELVLNRPDLIFMVGGTDTGAVRALETMVAPIRTALQVQDAGIRPAILFAGNSKLVPTVEAAFNDLTTVLYADNVRPRMDVEYLDSARTQLTKAFNSYNSRQRGAFRNLKSSTGLVPTARGYALVAEYIARTSEKNVLAVDMGSATTVMIAAFKGQVDTVVSANYGLGHGAPNLVRQAGAENVRPWLPFESSNQQVADYARNKSVRPSSVPVNVRDLYFEQGLLRAGIQHLIQSNRHDWPDVGKQGALRNVDLILAGGKGMTGSGRSGWDLMLIADAVQPTGITQVKADPYGLIPAIGAIATINSDAAVHLLSNDDLDHLGTIISLEGQPQPDRWAARITVTTDDGETFKQEIMGGELLLLPVRTGRAISLRIKAGRGMRVAGKGSFKKRIEGGRAGILIDARGRDLVLASDASARSVQMPAWIAQAAGIAAHPIPQDWLIPVSGTDKLDALFDEALSADAGPSERDKLVKPGDDFFDDVLADPELESFEDDPFDDLDELRSLSK
ncbi:MAG: glutamate mutase L [Anaerolineae bacterium]|nr:glutamate mutase L [Anaerolineae bacterium]